MFSANTYIARRAELRRRIGNGLILIPGNTFSPNNYPNNAYYFRQDSTFLYYFGLNLPTLMAVIDAESGEEMLFGDDCSIDDIIWMGPQPSMVERGSWVGVERTAPLAAAAEGVSTLYGIERLRGKESDRAEVLRDEYEKLGIDMEDTISIGDSDNDIQMTLMAGLGLACENACDSLKKVADKIICTNDEHVIRYVQKNYFNSEEA